LKIIIKTKNCNDYYLIIRLGKNIQLKICHHKIEACFLQIRKILTHHTKLAQAKIFMQIKAFKRNNNSKTVRENIKYELLLTKIKKRAKMIYNTYLNNQNKNLLKIFLKWRENILLDRYYTKNKPLIEASCEKKFQNKKYEYELKLNQKEKENNGMKANINILNENNNKSQKKVKSYEEKEFIFTNKLKSLEEEVNTMEEELKHSENETKLAEEKKANLENYLSELEQTYKGLDEQIKEKDYNLNVYVREMNDILDIYEKKSNELSVISKETEDESNADLTGNFIT
jgi:hypothetical protein